jgi:hypothetical protein
VIEVDVAVAGCGLEEESPARDGVERCQPTAARTDEQREHTGMDCDLERLDAGALCDRPQLALYLERVRRVGHDDTGSLAHRTASGQDLAWPVRDVLASHLHQPEG